MTKKCQSWFIVAKIVANDNSYMQSQIEWSHFDRFLCVGLGMLLNFSSMINMSMFFNFVTIVFKTHMFKLSLSRCIKIQAFVNLQNKLQVDEILSFFYF